MGALIKLFDVPLDTSDIPRRELDIAAQTRTNPLPWKGQFSPQLVEVLLRQYAPRTGHVLDPFVGSGTVLGESLRRGLAATGLEVNPAAAILARMYTWANQSREAREAAYNLARRSLQRLLSITESALSASKPRTVRPQEIANLARDQGDNPAAGLVAAALLLSDPTWSAVPIDRLTESLRRLRDFLSGLPDVSQAVVVLEGDARKVPLENGTVDLVLTSPPYINVFNYHQQYRPAVEALGFDVLDAARSEIGSNRKHRMNRFLTVVQYAIDMAAVLAEMNRVARPSARLVFIIGRESRVRGLSIYNGDLLCSVAAQACGLAVTKRQERSFINRFGERIVEDILHFHAGQSEIRVDPESPVAIGRCILEDLLLSAHGDVRDDLAAAIENAESVSPSPVYCSV